MNNKVRFDVGCYYLFGRCENGSSIDEIQVAQLVRIDPVYGLYFSFWYGGKERDEYVHPSQVAALGDNEYGTVTIKGWKGRYTVIDPELFATYVAKGLITPTP